MKDIDKSFRSKLDSYPSEVPDGLWDKIALDLDQKEDKRRIGWMFKSIIASAIILLVIGALVGIQLLRSGDNDSKVSLDSSAPSLSSDISFAEAELKKESYRSTTTESASSDQQTQLNSYSEQHYATQNAEINLTTSTAEGSNNIQIASGTSSSNSLIQASLDSKATESELAIKNAQKLTTQDRSLATILASNKRKSALDESPIIPQLKSQLSSTAQEEFVACSSMEKTHVYCPGNITTRPGFHAEFYLSPEFAVRSLTTRLDGFENYRSQRNDTEDQLYSFSTGFRASYTTKAGFTLKSGLNYTQINERFDYINPDSVRVIVEIDTNTGDTLDVRTEYGIGSTRTHNTYRMVDIPVLIGMELPFHDRFSLSINTGVYFNLLFIAEGRHLRTDFSPGAFEGDTFKPSLGLSFYGSLSMQYYLNPQVDLIIEPNLRYFSQSFTTENHPLAQEYLKVGLITGLRYNF